MNIKGWLISSYIVVMVLPLLAGYCLYALVNYYHAQQEVDDYFEKMTQLSDIRTVLEQPLLYRVKADHSTVEALKNAQTEIKLYVKSGYLIYTTNPYENTLKDKMVASELYANLYELNSSYRAYTYKAPVLQDGDIVGFYEIKLARSQWNETVAALSKVVFSLFVVLLLVILTLVVRSVKKKIIQPLEQLIASFHAFPKTKSLVPTHQSRDEIGALYTNFRTMQLELLAAEARTRKEQLDKQMMLASISHDLKTPLTSIRASAETTLHKPQKVATYMPVIITKADYMQKMLDDLTMYSVLQSPNFELQQTAVEAGELFDMLLLDYDSLMREKQIQFQTYNDAAGELVVDVRQWMRVVDNLVTNAVKFTPRAGTIQLIATQQPLTHALYPFTAALCTKPGTYFIVENSGDGIAEEELARVLQPLYQVDTARTKTTSGTGLGLTIAKQIIEKHGGTLQIASALGVGTSVVCYIPVGGQQHDMEKTIEIYNGG